MTEKYHLYYINNTTKNYLENWQLYGLDSACLLAPEAMMPVRLRHASLLNHLQAAV